MECPICHQEVWVLNNTQEKGDACYHCIKSLKLTICNYKIKKLKGDEEEIKQEEIQE